MEMTWLETFELLGLDLLAVLILALVALDLVDLALRHAWLTTRSRFGATRRQASARPPVKIGAPRHV
jgi:hypothetical protein